jgi:hypothetical protein
MRKSERLVSCKKLVRELTKCHYWANLFQMQLKSGLAWTSTRWTGRHGPCAVCSCPPSSRIDYLVNDKYTLVYRKRKPRHGMCYYGRFHLLMMEIYIWEVEGSKFGRASSSSDWYFWKFSVGSQWKCLNFPHIKPWPHPTENTQMSYFSPLISSDIKRETAPLYDLETKSFLRGHAVA